MYLNPIVRYCRRNNMPDLTLIVVLKATGYPSYYTGTPEQYLKDRGDYLRSGLAYAFTNTKRL